MKETIEIELTVNGYRRHDVVPARLLLADYIRDWCGLLGTHIGCAHGVCGSCTVLINDLPARACLVLAVQADGDEVRTVESLAEGAELSALQKAFQDNHALQCGFCTGGILMTAQALLEQPGQADLERIEEAVSGHLCRCTGYEPIFRAVSQVVTQQREDDILD